ncbi:hypothetical protein O6H91_19G036900 [Diphasiastrum complanatum]|uniref:Uncharacterized protein n=1 Tax=Diphasiastrum complanatum TaxID=34168 RepID=A0ACC2AU41_DIPCM|nr:hypothetical protein O6H91_19G036900 [Diphasiastrum complanatum]
MRALLWMLVMLMSACDGVVFAIRLGNNENNPQMAAASLRDGSRPTRRAVFALGSFWRAEAVFGCLPGVVGTQVGYSGGSKQNPDYRSIGDHAESVEVEYDPTVIRYEQLLDIFWSSHDPTQLFGQGPDVGEQYSDEEAALAVVSRKREQAKLVDTQVTTEIEALEMFYPAEFEHQKFEMKRRPILVQLLGDSTEEDNTKSTAAARLNGYAAGMCSPSFQKLIDNKLNLYLKYKPKMQELF